MALDARLRARMLNVLRAPDERGVVGHRLADDAERLWGRVLRLLQMNLIAIEPDVAALELACLALQLPNPAPGVPGFSVLGRSLPKERTEQAAELLVTGLGDEIDPDLLDRVTRLLHETSQRTPMIEDAKLLADALSLDDFGVAALMCLGMHVARRGYGLSHWLEGWRRSEMYGYWDARVKDSFHYDAVRQMARRRLEQARQAIRALEGELADDRPWSRP